MPWIRLTMVLLVFLGCGCAPFAYPTAHKVVAGKKFEPADIAWVSPGQTTRAEIEARFGAASKEDRSQGFAAYWWLTETGKQGWILFAAQYSSGAIEETYRNDAWLIAYDENNRVRHDKIQKLPRSGITPQFIKRFVAKK
jgi:hypothetical protein